MQERRATEIRNALQAAVTALGRDDVAVGEVVEAEGTVRFTLNKGRFQNMGEIPAEVLGDAQKTRDLVRLSLTKISTRVEQEHIKAAMEENSSTR